MLETSRVVVRDGNRSRGAAVREYFIECERRLLAGEGPIPGSSGIALEPEPALPPPPLPPSPPLPPLCSSVPDPSLRLVHRPGQPNLPDHLIPLTLPGFLCLMGFDQAVARTLAAEYGPDLARRTCLDGNGTGVGRHPVSRQICFARPVLDAWWAGVYKFLLNNPSRPVPPPIP